MEKVVRRWLYAILVLFVSTLVGCVRSRPVAGTETSKDTPPPKLVAPEEKPQPQPPLPPLSETPPSVSAPLAPSDPAKGRENDPLVSKLSSPDPEIRLQALQELGTKNTEESVALLFKALSDPTPRVKDLSEEVLKTQITQALSHGKILDLVIQSLGEVEKKSENDQSVSRRVLRILLAQPKLENLNLLSRLIPYLSHPSPQVRDRAQELLLKAKSQHPKIQRGVLELFYEEDRDAAERAFQVLLASPLSETPPDFVSSLCEALSQRKNPKATLLAEKLLAERSLAFQETLPHLKANTSFNADPEVQKAAYQAIYRCFPQEKFFEIVFRWQNGKSIDERLGAMRELLEKYPNERDTELLLVEQLRDKNPRIRAELVKSLKRLKPSDPAAIHALHRQLVQSNASDRAQILEVLQLLPVVDEASVRQDLLRLLTDPDPNISRYAIASFYRYARIHPEDERILIGKLKEMSSEIKSFLEILFSENPPKESKTCEKLIECLYETDLEIPSFASTVLSASQRMYHTFERDRHLRDLLYAAVSDDSGSLTNVFAARVLLFCPNREHRREVAEDIIIQCLRDRSHPLRSRVIPWMPQLDYRSDKLIDEILETIYFDKNHKKEEQVELIPSLRTTQTCVTQRAGHALIRFIVEPDRQLRDLAAKTFHEITEPLPMRVADELIEKTQVLNSDISLQAFEILRTCQYENDFFKAVARNKLASLRDSGEIPSCQDPRVRLALDKTIEALSH